MSFELSHNISDPQIQAALDKGTNTADGKRMLMMAETSAAASGRWNLGRSGSADIPYLGYDPSSFLGTVVDQTIGNRQPPLALCYMDALTEAIKRRTLAGSGFSWLPESAVGAEIADGRIVRVGGESWEATLTLSLFCNFERLDKTGQAVWETL